MVERQTNQCQIVWRVHQLLYVVLLLTMFGGLYGVIAQRLPQSRMAAQDALSIEGGVRREAVEQTTDGVLFIWLGREFPVEIIQPQYTGIISTRFWVHPSVTRAELRYGAHTIDVSGVQSPRVMHLWIDHGSIDGVFRFSVTPLATNQSLQDAQLPIVWAFSELTWRTVGDAVHGAWLVATWLVLFLGVMCIPRTYDWVQLLRWLLWAGVVTGMAWIAPIHSLYWVMSGVFGVGAVSILSGFARIRPLIWMIGLAVVVLLLLDVMQATTAWYVIALCVWSGSVVWWFRQQSPIAVDDIATVDRTYRADIDGLRAIAVLTVIIFHAFPDVLPGGFVGVDMFFVLSGYLITHIVISEVWQERFSIVEFYQRRIRRIFPALIVMVLVVMVAFWFILFLDEYALLMQTIVASIGFVANIFYYVQVDYFAPETFTQPLVHLWSLGVEEQFYIFWPLLIVLMRGRRTALLAAFVAVVICSFVANVWLTTHDEAAAFYLPISRFWELAVGGIVAWMSAFIGTLQDGRYRAIQPWLTGIGLVVLVVGFWLIDAQKLFPGYWALLPVLGTAAVLSGNPQHRLQRWLAQPQLVYIGLISYPLYLWHWPVLVFSYLIYDDQSNYLVPIGLVMLSGVLAHATYQFVERPIRFTARHRISSWRLGLAMASVGVVAGLLWYVPIATRVSDFLGREDIVGDWIIRNEMSQHSRAMTVDDCRAIVGVNDNCRTSDTATGSEYVFMGDSHARSLYNGLYQDDTVINNGYLVVADGCLPILNTDTFINTRFRYYCQPPDGQVRQLAQLAQLTQRKSDTPQYVFLIGRYSIVQGDDMLDKTHNIVHLRASDTDDELSVASSVTALAQGLDAMLAKLTADASNRVVFVHQMPEFPFVPRNCMRTLVNRDGWACGVERARIDAHFAQYRAAVAPVLARYPQVAVFDPFAAFCDDTMCYSVQDGELLFYDQDHLNMRGARRVMQLIQAQFP
ncbi:MAG: hypothetical protein RI985_297 [Chloroflexota bacterium]